MKKSKEKLGGDRDYDKFQKDLVRSLPGQAVAYVENLKKKNEIKRIDENNFAIRECIETGKLKQKSANNYAMVRKLPCVLKSGEKCDLIICMKCNSESHSLIATVKPNTEMSEDVKNKAAKTCWHASALSLVNLNQYPVKSKNKSKLKNVVISSTPHITASYDGKTYGLIKFNPNRGASTGKCTTCKGKGSKCSHAKQWLANFGEKMNIGAKTRVENVTDNAKKTSTTQENQTIQDKLNFPWSKSTSKRFLDLEEKGVTYEQLEDLIPKYDPVKVCPHGSKFDCRSPR